MEPDVIEKVYRKYAGEAYLYSLALCKNRDIAEDIVSETFIKAILSIGISEDNFKFWLLRVCKTTWIDMYRKNRHIAENSFDEMAEQQNSTDVLQEIINEESRQTIADAILSLPDIYREVITLYYFNEIPQAHIAELMNLSNGAVRTLIYRGRKLLAEKLSRDQV